MLAYLSAKGEVVSTHYNEETVTVHCRIPQKYLGRITEEVISFKDRIPTPSDPDELVPETDEDDVRSVDDVA